MKLIETQDMKKRKNHFLVPMDLETDCQIGDGKKDWEKVEIGTKKCKLQNIRLNIKTSKF